MVKPEEYKLEPMELGEYENSSEYELANVLMDLRGVALFLDKNTLRVFVKNGKKLKN